MSVFNHRIGGRRAHVDSFVKRLHKITDAAISASRAEIDAAMEEWLASHQPASEGSRWLLELIGVNEPRYLAAAEAPRNGRTLQEGIHNRFECVSDANNAIGFSREIDALNMVRALGLEIVYAPREHEFIA